MVHLFIHRLSQPPPRVQSDVANYHPSELGDMLEARWQDLHDRLVPLQQSARAVLGTWQGEDEIVDSSGRVSGRAEWHLHAAITLLMSYDKVGRVWGEG